MQSQHIGEREYSGMCRMVAAIFGCMVQCGSRTMFRRTSRKDHPEAQ